MFVRVWGARGSISVAREDTVVYGGHTTCVEIRAGERLIIVDAGSGIRSLGKSLMAQEKGPVDADIFLSHTHLDHIAGLLMFEPFFKKKNVFRIHGPRSRSGKAIKDTIEAFFVHDYWPIGISSLTAATEWRDLEEGTYDMGGGLTVKTLLLEHPAPVLGYRFEYGGKSVALVFDHESYAPGNARVIPFLQGADLVVFDSQYTEEEYFNGKQGWGHSSFEGAIATTEKAGVKKTLLFFHHDPDRTDEALAALEKKYAKKSTIEHVYAAKENAVYEV
ncbi:MAG: MBL fold metallo-hydrolase [Spirochaetaceae bacterium]|jgi:phosphoribosyl 1,2-cyclic phosphodiesterase|nr:MBL fold metallo-hydrolase [Spirochaetaceae bacterium]